MKQEAHWDIAWQIFDEVNKENDTERFIDLNCLELEDALAITKQKIYDAAQSKSESFNSKQSYTDNSVLSILTSKHHLVPLSDSKNQWGGNSQNKAVANGVMDMIANDLELDNYYNTINKIVLVRINQYTIENPILKEW